MISSCRASVNANQIVVRSTAEGVTEQPETERGRNWTAVSDKTKEQQVSGLVVLRDVVPPWQEYILHNILACQPLLYSLHGSGGNRSCVAKIREMIPRRVALLVWPTTINHLDRMRGRQIQQTKFHSLLLNNVENKGLYKHYQRESEKGNVFCCCCSWKKLLQSENLVGDKGRLKLSLLFFLFYFFLSQILFQSLHMRCIIWILCFTFCLKQLYGQYCIITMGQITV